MTFKQTDVARAVKAVIKAGCEVARVEVDKNGRIIVIAGKLAALDEKQTSPWDKAVTDLEAR